MIKILFFLVLNLPNHQPIPFSEERASLEECLADVAQALKVGPPERGQIQAGCVITEAAERS